MIDIIAIVNNSHKDITRMLLSIILQINLRDINVYIIDNSSEHLSDNQYQIFKDKINIKILRPKEKISSGSIKQFGLENSNGEYILFLNSNNLLYDCFSIKYMYDLAKKTQADLVVGNSTEKNLYNTTNSTSEFSIIPAKMYKRTFLEKNNMCFTKSKYYNDLFFDSLILKKANYIEHIDQICLVKTFNNERFS